MLLSAELGNKLCPNAIALVKLQAFFLEMLDASICSDLYTSGIAVLWRIEEAG